MTDEDGSLLLLPFDRRRRATGDPSTALLPDVFASQNGRPIWDVSPSGTLAYFRGRRGRSMLRVSRDGSEQPPFPTRTTSAARGPRPTTIGSSSSCKGHAPPTPISGSSTGAPAPSSA